MSHGVSPVTIKDVPAIVTAEPYKLPPFWKTLALIFIAIGVVAFAWGIMTPEKAKHAWIVFQVNFTFWFLLAAASTCFSAVLQICNAQWARPLYRLFESGANFFLWSPVILLVLFVLRGYNEIFIWAHETFPGKEVWLQPWYLYMRDILSMLFLIYFGRRVVYHSIRRDIGAIRSGLTKVEGSAASRWSEKKYDCYVTNWGSDSRAEIQRSTDCMIRLSPAVIIIYSIVVSLVAYDQMMSIDPEWYSTLFGGFIFMGGAYIATAWCGMLVAVSRAVHPLFVSKVERRTLHDLGKLIFGFGIFWAYLMWSHYLPIWYANMPEETHYVLVRLREQPWHSVAWIVLGMCFILPFLLGLSRDVKQTPPLLFCTGMIVICGIWLEHYLLLVPSLYPHTIPFGLVEVAVTLGFLGAYVLSTASFLAKAPLIPFGDLYLKTDPSH
jgi:hypothetical protein